MGGLVGRTTESARLKRWWDAVVSGEGGLAVVRGPGGIGKTALVEELFDSLDPSGAKGFVIRAGPMETDAPFSMLSRALGCVETAGGARASIAAALADEPQERAGVFHHQLANKFADLMEAEALDGPSLVVLDDAQWADDGTFEALAGAARATRGISLGLLIATRPTERPGLTALLAGSRRAPMNVELQPLSPEEAQQVCTARFGKRPTPELAHELELVGGNPFYVHALLDALDAEGRLSLDGEFAGIDSVADGPSVPRDLALAVLYRLAQLPESARRMLRVAAVLGSELRLADIVAVGVDHGEALLGLETLRHEGVLVDSGDHLRFSHDLVREVIYEEMGPTVRDAEHRRIAGCLAVAGRPVRELVPHITAGATAPDAEGAAWLRTAAFDTTMGADTASRLLAKAVELDPHLRTDYDVADRRARLCFWAGDSDGALEIVENYLQASHDPRSRRRVAEMAFAVAARRGDWPARERWLDYIAALPNSSDSVWGQLFDSRMAFYRGDLRTASALTEQLAERASTLEAEEAVETLNQATWLAIGEARVRDALRWSDELIGHELPLTTRALYWRHRLWALSDADRFTESDEALSICREAAESQGQLPMLVELLGQKARLAFQVGFWDEAAVGAEAAINLAAEVNTVFPSEAWDALHWMAVHRGDPLAADLQRSLWSSAAEVSGLLARSEDDAAAPLTCDLANALISLPTKERGWIDLLPIALRACLATQQPELAAALLALAEQVAAIGDSPSVAMAVARCRVLEHPSAEKAQEVVRLTEASPRRVWVAGALEDAALGLPSEEAVRVLRRAAETYAKVGALASLARVEDLLSKLGSPRATSGPIRGPRPVSGWGALTEAEERVVALAAQGLTNREIGSRLYVSHRTVSTHLAHVFDKLGLRSRMELAREFIAREQAAANLEEN